MSREEKLAVIRGAREPDATFMGQAGWIRGVPRLGIPDLRFADGPPGVLVRHASTGMPSTLTLAATFSREEAAANGALIGRDARALGVDVILEPYINMYRDSTFERAYNTLGEDPVLTGTLAAHFVTAAQAEGVMAQAKHMVAYEGAEDAIVDGQALREVYLVPFKAVIDAGVASVMCAYNRINGIYSCGNEEVLERTLRDEYGFKGFVTSDWGATHGAEFITRGLDMEQPGVGPWAHFSLGNEPEEPKMTAAEVDDLVEIMTVGVPEEQSYPLLKRATIEPVPPPGGFEESRRGPRTRQRVGCGHRSRRRARTRTDGAIRLARSRASTHDRAASPSRRMRASSSAPPSAVRCCSRTTACCRFVVPTSIRSL